MTVTPTFTLLDHRDRAVRRAVPVEIRVLGSLEVLCGGSPVVISGVKERALVVLLALRAGRVVPTERLIEWVWDRQPPALAEAALRVLVSRVRKALAAVGAVEVIHTRKPGYLLMVDEVDVHLFEQLAARGRSELAAGRPQVAAETLSAALALWLGEGLAEASCEQLGAESTRWQEARLAAEEARIEAELACGGHADLVGGLELLCRLHPLRERLWAHRITALYRCGRQADALATYQELRTTLADELGIDPSPPLRQLEAAVLTQDPALQAPAARSATPRPPAVSSPSPPLPSSTGPRGEAPTLLPADTTLPGRDEALTDAALAAPVLMEPTTRSPGRPDDASIPLPGALSIAETAPCVGRDGAQRELMTVWDAVLAGAPRMVLVRGEAGVGKTRLLRELARGLHRRGALVLYGRCDEDIAIPYRPIRECLHHYLTSASDSRLAEHDRHHLGEIPRLVPDLARRMPNLPGPTLSDPEAERYLLFSAVARLLGEIATGTPLVLVLDDLHWADRPTVQLLRHIASASLGRVLVLGTYRDRELLPGQPLTGALAALCRESTVAHIRLEGLTQPAVASIMEAMTGRALDRAGLELACVLSRETGGNAFLVVEEIRHLREVGVLERTSAGHGTVAVDLAAMGLPHSVHQVVAGRLGELGGEARELLVMAAVIGEQFDLNLLCAAARANEDHVLDALEAAERRALVTESPGMLGTFRFAHALVRHVVYQQLGTTRQARLHTRVGDALEGLCGDDPGDRTSELARHFLAAWPTDAGKAARYARRAGERALAALAPAEAHRWFTQAIEALAAAPDDPEKVVCLVGLGEAERQLGNSRARETLLDAAHRAQRLGEPQFLIRAALANNRGFFARLGQIDTDLVMMLEAALEVVLPDSPDRARLLSRLAAKLAFHPDVSRRRALADEAVAVARRCGDAAALLDALTRPDTALMVPKLSEHRLARLQEAQVLADRVDDPVARYWAAHQLGVLLIERADSDGADHAFARAAEISAQVGQPVLRWASAYVRCCQVLLAGDVDEAEELGSLALQIGVESGQQDAELIYGGQLFCVRWHQGRLDEIIPALTALAADNPDFLPIRPALALAEAVSGDPEQARRLLRAAADTGFELPRTVPWLITTCAWAEVAAELAEDTAGSVLYDRLLAWHHLFAGSGPTPLHCVAQSLGRLAAMQGRFQSADEHFAEALSVHRRMRTPFCTAATELAWGRLLLSRDPVRAEPLLASAAKIAAQHGYRYLQR